MEDNELELESLVNMQEFEVTEKDLPSDLRQRLFALKGSYGKYKKHPTEAQKSFIMKADAILADDIHTFAEIFHNFADEDNSNQNPNPMEPNPPIDPNNPPPPPPPADPPPPPADPPPPPADPPPPPADPPPPPPPVAKRDDSCEHLDYITGGG